MRPARHRLEGACPVFSLIDGTVPPDVSCILSSDFCYKWYRQQEGRSNRNAADYCPFLRSSKLAAVRSVVASYWANTFWTKVTRLVSNSNSLDTARVKHT